jgi:hypothetical protein
VKPKSLAGGFPVPIYPDRVLIDRQVTGSRIEAQF